MDRRRSHTISTFSFFICLLLLFQASSSYGSPSRKSGRSSVFSLFNLRERSRFWSESVIRGDFDDLQSSSPGRVGVLNYTRAGNIANYLKLMEVDSMYLPVPVNFIFIGFEGNGNQDFQLHPDELERWFLKIDHIFEHTRVPPIGEVLAPFYRTSVDKVQRHHLPTISHINYNFSVHAIQMGEKVTSVFEHAIKVLARKDDVSTNRDDVDALWQVDVSMMDVLFTSLVDYLQLENAYNIFILNPKHEKRARYGYRWTIGVDFCCKFMPSPIPSLDKDLQTKILQSGNIPESILALDKIRRPLYEKHPMTKFSWTIAEDTDTAEWYNICLDPLNNVEKFYRGKETADIIQSKVLQLLKGKNEDLKFLLEKELKSGDLSNLHAECLTDSWIGNNRWAFIDLTAGPFSWGPAVGGEGVRTELSLPNVGKTIGAVEDLSVYDIGEISEDEAEDRLQDAIQEKFAVFGDKDHQAIDILLAEIDIYELFAFKHCKGRKVKLALCEELDERMQDLKNELQSFEGEEYDENHKRKAIEALRRMENWNLFSDTHEEFQNYTVARDTFLAHLGATLWGSMRHVISPSIADGAFHYYETISFQLFFITQEQYRLTLSEDPALAMAFSVARRAAAVPMLLVNGTYRKTVRSYVDSAILQYQLQRMNDRDSLKGQPITLIHLKGVNLDVLKFNPTECANVAGAHAHSRSTLEVPIFWFIHGDPLLVDKHYQAKALSDMVIVVQSEEPSWESHLQCNGQSLLWDLRSPIKAALASVSEHLAGLLPLHLVYSQAHETAIEDWIWSVGCNPFSITSQGWHISQFQSDTIARSYIISTLEESIQTVNSAIHLLLMERTTEKTFKLFQSQERELVNKYNYVVSLWRRISTVTGDLRYLDAMRLLYTLEDASKGFVDQVNATIALLHPIHCTRDRKVDVEFDLTTIPAFLIVLGILYVLLKPRRPKPKIN
ncbi:transmembrane protein [Citrus sinensis]|uniref:Transmembrane protein n=1 Tax=Citrus sinensis TaxID=2711 RepID=A0ACB8P4N3_CITSI|nr:transmembrane protein [Citrus sinensis]